MLSEFARQIDAEKKAKDLETTAKVAAYQEMLKGNAIEQERKKEIKEEERQENIRLFELQIAMAEKQVRTCQHFLSKTTESIGHAAAQSFDPMPPCAV